MKIFGREPAAYAGVLLAVLGVLQVLDVFGANSNEKVALISAAGAAVFAAVTAYFTKTVSTAVVVGAAQAVLALLVGFGVDLSPDLTAAIVSGLQLALAGFLRQNTSPAEFPGFNSDEADWS